MTWPAPTPVASPDWKRAAPPSFPTLCPSAAAKRTPKLTPGMAALARTFLSPNGAAKTKSSNSKHTPFAFSVNS